MKVLSSGVSKRDQFDGSGDGTRVGGDWGRVLGDTEHGTGISGL